MKLQLSFFGEIHIKKLLSLLCLIGILTGVLSACGKDETDEAAPKSDKTLLTAATELANELDQVPTIAELINGKMENSVTIEGVQPLSSADEDYGIAPLGVELCGVDTLPTATDSAHLRSSIRSRKRDLFR